MSTPKQNTPNESQESFAFPPENYKYLAIGFAAVIIGFILMIGGGSSDPNVFDSEALFSFQRVTLSPIIILGGFGFVVWAIMHKPRTNE